MRRFKRHNTLKSKIIEYISKNIKAYTILIIIFLIGLVLGIIFVNNTNEAQQTEISSYINNFIEALKSNQTISSKELIKEAIKNDLIFTIILWFLGSTIIGMPLIYLFILYKGYSIGYSMSAIVASLGTTKGIIFILITMVLPYIIYIPAILSLGVSGIQLYKLIINDRRKENIKVQIAKHTLFSVLIFILILLSSIIETYMSVVLMNFLDYL